MLTRVWPKLICPNSNLQKQNYISEKHLALAKKINNIEEIVEAYADLKENEYNLHNYAKAHEYEKLYSDYRDSSYNETVIQEYGGDGIQVPE